MSETKAELLARIAKLEAENRQLFDMVVAARVENELLKESDAVHHELIRETTRVIGVTREQIEVTLSAMVYPHELAAKATAGRRGGADTRARTAQALKAQGMTNEQVRQAMKRGDGTVPSDRTVTRWLKRPMG